MGKIKDTMKFIERSIGKIDAKYDISMDNVCDIYEASANTPVAICNGFRFGYMQGMKAAKAEMQKGGAV